MASRKTTVKNSPASDSGSTTIDGIKFSWEWSYRIDGENTEEGLPPTERRDLRSAVVENGENINLSSVNVGISCAITAAGEGVENFSAGITQTVYASRRQWDYNSSQQTTVTDQVSITPAWDGNADDAVPWFDLADPQEFDDDEVDLFFNDAPFAGPTDDHKDLGKLVDPTAESEGPTLKAIRGEDSFRLFCAVVRNDDGHIFTLDSLPWYVVWNADVDASEKTVDFLPDAGTFLNSSGSGDDGQPKLDGEPSEALIKVTYT